MKPIFITGATGNIGSFVSTNLREKGVPIRLGMRNPDKMNSHEVHFDFSDSSTYRDAVEGCSAVFLLRPPAIANTKQTLNIFIDEAYAAGVEHIVFVSVTGADNNSIVPHHAVEQKLKQSGKSYTILRPGFFSQNLGDAYREDIQVDDRIYLPSAMGLINFIDARDIGEVAVNALMHSKDHINGEYTLVGQQAVTFADVAKLLSKELNRPIQYKAASILGYWMHLRCKKMPLMKVIVQTVLHAGIRKGQAHYTDDTIVKLLGRSPRTIQNYIRDNISLWND